MVWFFLIFVLVLDRTEPIGRPIEVFTTLEDCGRAGDAQAARERESLTPVQGYWQCLEVNFDLWDPLPEDQPPPEQPSPRPSDRGIT